MSKHSIHAGQLEISTSNKLSIDNDSKWNIKNLLDPNKRVIKVWSTNLISWNLLNMNNELTNEVVVCEMCNVGITEITPDTISKYHNELILMRKDISTFTRQIYEAICIRKGNELGIPYVQSWSEIGNAYIMNPSWKTIEQLYHILYSSIDELPSIHEKIEENWMTVNQISYYRRTPEVVFVGNSGIRSIILNKINMMRKDFNRKIAKKHGFKITKSVARIDGKQAHRRVINQFKKEFVTMDQKAFILKNNINDFDDYLHQLHKDKYEPYETKTCSLFENKQKQDYDKDSTENEEDDVIHEMNHIDSFYSCETIESTDNQAMTLPSNLPEKGNSNNIKVLQKKQNELLKQQKKLDELKQELDVKMNEFKVMQLNANKTKETLESKQTIASKQKNESKNHNKIQKKKNLTKKQIKNCKKPIKVCFSVIRKHTYMKT
jgi:hypothetical protein